MGAVRDIKAPEIQKAGHLLVPLVTRLLIPVARELGCKIDEVRWSGEYEIAAGRQGISDATRRLLETGPKKMLEVVFKGYWVQLSKEVEGRHQAVTLLIDFYAEVFFDLSGKFKAIPYAYPEHVYVGVRGLENTVLSYFPKKGRGEVEIVRAQEERPIDTPPAFSLEVARRVLSGDNIDILDLLDLYFTSIDQPIPLLVWMTEVLDAVRDMLHGLTVSVPHLGLEFQVLTLSPKSNVFMREKDTDTVVRSFYFYVTPPGEGSYHRHVQMTNIPLSIEGAAAVQVQWETGGEQLSVTLKIALHGYGDVGKIFERTITLSMRSPLPPPDALLEGLSPSLVREKIEDFIRKHALPAASAELARQFGKVPGVWWNFLFSFATMCSYQVYRFLMSLPLPPTTTITRTEWKDLSDLVRVSAQNDILTVGGRAWGVIEAAIYPPATKTITFLRVEFNGNYGIYSPTTRPKPGGKKKVWVSGYRSIEVSITRHGVTSFKKGETKTLRWESASHHPLLDELGEALDAYSVAPTDENAMRRLTDIGTQVLKDLTLALFEDETLEGLRQRIANLKERGEI